MIGVPPKAIKKIKNDAHREIVVGHMVAYGFFPSTSEGIEEAKKFVAGLDQWVAPSELPNYYNDLESDLMTGKETAGIRNIKMILEEFYFGGGAAQSDPDDIPIEVEVVEVEQKDPDEPIVVTVEAPFELSQEQVQPRKRIRLPRLKNTIKGRVTKEVKKSTAERMAEAFDRRLDDLVDAVQNPPPPVPPRTRKQKQVLAQRAKKVRASFKKTNDPWKAENLSGFVGLKIKKAFGRAAEARRIAKEQGADEQGKGYFLKKALGFEFGGDRFNRLQGTFSKSPTAAKDPASSADERFLAGIDSALTPPEIKQGTLFNTNQYNTKTGVSKVVSDGIDRLQSSFERVDNKFRNLIEIKRSSVQSDLSKLSQVVNDLKKTILKNVDVQKEISDVKAQQLELLGDIAQDDKAKAKEASMEKGSDLSGQSAVEGEPGSIIPGEGEGDGDGGGLDLFDKLKNIRFAKWLRRIKNPGRFMRSLGRLGRMRVGRFLRPAGNLLRGATQLGARVGQGAQALISGGAATTAAIVGGVGLAASGIGEGLFQLTKKGGAGEQTRDALKKKGEEIGGPLGSLIGGVGNLAGFSTEATKVTGNALDAIGAPFRYAIEGIRYPFLNEEDRKKQADNLAKFDARIREYSRGWMNRIDFMNVVPDEKGGFGNIYGNNDAQKEMMEKMSEGGTIPQPTFQGISGARLTGDAGGVNAMIGEAGPEMLLRAGQGGMNPLQSLAPMILAAREVTKRAGTWADPIENFVRQTTDPIAKSLNLPVAPIETTIGKGQIPQMEEPDEEDEKGPLGFLKKLFGGGGKKRKRRKKNGPGSVAPVNVTGIPLGEGETAKAGELVTGLMSRGFTREEAAAIVGNLWAESGFNTGAINPKSGAYGLMQWLGGRKDKLVQFAREKGKSPADLSLQLDYIAWELKGGNQYESAQFEKAMAYGPDIASKTRGFAQEVERAGAHELAASMSKRVGAGQSAYNASTGAVAPTVAAVPQQPAPPQPLLPPTQPSILTLPVPPANRPPAPTVSPIFSGAAANTAYPTTFNELRQLALGVR